MTCFFFGRMKYFCKGERARGEEEDGDRNNNTTKHAVDGSTSLVGIIRMLLGASFTVSQSHYTYLDRNWSACRTGSSRNNAGRFLSRKRIESNRLAIGLS